MVSVTSQIVNFSVVLKDTECTVKKKCGCLFSWEILQDHTILNHLSIHCKSGLQLSATKLRSVHIIW